MTDEPEAEQVDDTDALRARIEELETEASTLRIDGLRAQIAHERNLPAAAARLLTGTTAEEIEAAADALAELRRDATPAPVVPSEGSSPENINSQAEVLRHIWGR